MTDFVTNMTDQKHHEKYDSSNPIARKMINGFMDSIKSLVEIIQSEINSVTECGCGQGHVNQHLEHLLPSAIVRGFDIDESDLNIAKQNQIRTSTQLYQKDIYQINNVESADLIVCCEVLEHLNDPHLALKKMAALNAKYYLFSVPNEPLWRILNFLRGKYVQNWGNTPDHCNHWSPRKFKQFIAQELDIVTVKTPLPWTMILAQPKD